MKYITNNIFWFLASITLILSWLCLQNDYLILGPFFFFLFIGFLAKGAYYENEKFTKRLLDSVESEAGHDRFQTEVRRQANRKFLKVINGGKK